MSEYVIGRRQLYILPTRVGWYYALILLALFAIAVKFNNQAAFMMLFALVAIGIIGMHYTHNNVIGLQLTTNAAKPIFVGETAHFPVQIQNLSIKIRQAIWLICDGHRQVFDLEENSKQDLVLDLPTLHRGYLNCSDITLTSQFPLGIFFCWSKRFSSPERCIVYPQPLDLIDFPDSGDNSSQTQSRNVIKNAAADYSGMKAYQPGDRPRDIHWPSLAKTQKLITVQHEDQSNSSVNLSWFSLPQSLSVEDKLSQLCHWVVDAEKNGTKYQLEMPNNTIQFDNGFVHYHECLTVLALWGKND